MKMTEKFCIKVKEYPNTYPENWGIVWETSGTEGGFTSEEAARKAARAQGGKEIASDESQTWSW